ncbi:hypothetical protein SLS60_005785 [Paraconiothyrium brasiliense]|uniref:Uncharacterized protein n=1 Tax=Paraconiothyrium brasiliense TaxID=300254 RepID=A0ABR3RE04_9PLEO
MATPTPHPILLIGLNPLDPPPNAPVSPHVLASIANKISLDVARAARNGFPCTIRYLDWRSPFTALAELEEVLVQGPGYEEPSDEGSEGASNGIDAKADASPKWSAILFGQGLRMYANPELFEGAIERVRRVCAGDVKVLFNDGADRQCAALERGFCVRMGE